MLEVVVDLLEEGLQCEVVLVESDVLADDSDVSRISGTFYVLSDQARLDANHNQAQKWQRID